MKQQLILITTLLLSVYCYKVEAQSCTESQAKKNIENSDMKIMFRNGGDMFWDGNGSAQYAVPYVYGQTSQTHATFAGATWMGAYDDGGNLLLAAQTYRSSGNDYWAGPLSPATGSPVVDACTNFDRIWKVKRWAIERHRADYNDNGIIDGPTDLSLLKWPGKGNPHFAAQMGFALPNQDLAPFYDVNGDGVYTPLQGDYPVFDHGNSGAIAEEILWSVFNDNGNLHTQTNGLPLKVEVQQTAYLFSCNNDPLLNKTLFVKHKVISRNALKMNNYYYGVWADFDMGCSADDYVGTIPSKNTIYAYNSDANDDNPCGSNGMLGYGVNPPVQAVTILNHSLSKSIYNVNNTGPTGDPSSAIGYYNLLDGKFVNGTPQTRGGNGYNPNNPNAVATDHMFPDHPENWSGWSMYNTGLSGLDQRVIGSIYKDSLMPGESFTIDLAYSYHRDPDSNYIQNVNLMYQQIDQVQQYYDNDFALTSCAMSTYCTANCVYPGDANNNGIANDFDIFEMGLHYGESAVTRTSIGDNWLPYTPPTPIMNAYVDANGNNTIENLDLVANTANYKETHSLYTGNSEGNNVVGTDLFFKRFYSTLPLIVTDTIVPLERHASMDVYFGDIGQTITDLYGVTFRVSYDENVLELENNHVFGLGVVGLGDGWLADDGAPVYSRQIDETGKVNYVGTRLNQINYTGGGKIGRLNFKVKANAPVSAATMSTQICFEDFKAIRADGTEITIGGQCETVLYRDPNFVPSSIVTISEKAPAINIYPSPVTHELNIDLGTERTEVIELFNVLGECVHTSTKETGLVTIAKNNLAQGMYTVVVTFENGTRSSHKVIFN